MKTIILFLILIMPISAHAGLFCGDKPKECPVKKEICHHSIKVSEDITIVFKGGCDEIKHVGIIFKKNRRILQIDNDLEIISDQRLKNDDVLNGEINKTFPDLKRIIYKMHSDK